MTRIPATYLRMSIGTGYSRELDYRRPILLPLEFFPSTSMGTISSLARSPSCQDTPDERPHEAQQTCHECDSHDGRLSGYEGVELSIPAPDRRMQILKLTCRFCGRAFDARRRVPNTCRNSPSRR